jgi:hypothetical protein
LIIKYLQKNPLSSPRQIRVNHSKHEYHSKYLQKFLDELIHEKKIDVFLKKYFVIPKQGQEINLLVNIVKTIPLTKPVFRKLVFDVTSKNPTIHTIINNCICFYHLKLKINKLEPVISTASFNSNFIKFLKLYSDDNYYSGFFVDKNFLKKNPLWKIKDNSNNTLEKRISNFLKFYWMYCDEYYKHLKNNRISLKEIFHRIFNQYNEGKSQAAETIGITNKGLKRSLNPMITEQGIYKDSIQYDSKWNLVKSKADKMGSWNDRPRILEIGRLILGHRLPSDRKKYAKKAEETTGIPFTKLIPMKGYSDLLKDAPTEPFQSIDPLIRQDYAEHYKEIGLPPHKRINKKTGESYYLFHDPKDFSKLTREWKGTK